MKNMWCWLLENMLLNKSAHEIKDAHLLNKISRNRGENCINVPSTIGLDHWIFYCQENVIYIYRNYPVRCLDLEIYQGIAWTLLYCFPSCRSLKLMTLADNQESLIEAAQKTTSWRKHRLVNFSAHSNPTSAHTLYYAMDGDISIARIRTKDREKFTCP